MPHVYTRCSMFITRTYHYTLVAAGCMMCTMSDTALRGAHSPCTWMATVCMAIYDAPDNRMHARVDASHCTHTHQLHTHTFAYDCTRNNLAVTTCNIHAAAPMSCSYNYIFKVLFIAPSWYLFSIGFGHMSIFWWSLAPIRIPVQKNNTRTMYTVYWYAQVAYGALTLNGPILQIRYTCTRNGNTCIYNNSMRTSFFPTVT